MARPTTYRPPVKIIGTEVDTENLVITKDGDIRHSNRVIIAESDGVDENGKAYVGIGGLKSGYYCAKCLEAQDEAFPEKCWLCGFAMRDKQGEFFAKGYEGNVRVGPSTTLDTELAAMEEWEYAQARKADPRKLSSSVLAQALELFERLAGQTPLVITNGDDPGLKSIRASFQFGLSESVDCRPEAVKAVTPSVRFTLKGTDFELPLAGWHNLSNALAALCVCENEGATLNKWLSPCGNLRAFCGDFRFPELQRG